MKELESLSKINKVEAPPFLLTRIRARIASLNEAAPVQWKWALAATALLVFALNAAAILKTEIKNDRPEPGLEQVIKGMNLSPSNGLYDE